MSGQPQGSPGASGGEPSAGRAYAGTVAAAFRDVMRQPNMRRAQLSSAAAWTSEWAFVTALAVYAFEQGGAEAVGIVGFVRVLPAAVSLPFLSALADRMPRQRLLTATGAFRATATALAAAAALADLTPVIVYALAAVATIAFTAYRPAHSALLPSLCTTGGELTQANAVRTLLDGVSALIGPLAVAAVLQATGAEFGFLVTAVCAAYSALAMALIRFEAPPLLPSPRRPVLNEVRDGFAALTRQRPVLLLIGLATAQAMVRGALNVLIIVIAIELIDAGESGVGVLWAAVGVGGLLGGAATFGLVASRHLGAVFGVGVALWSAPLALAAATSSTPLTLALLAVVGIANALVDASAITLLQRLLDDRVMGRVFGTAEMLWTVALALGSLLASGLVGIFDVRGALVVTGLSLPLLSLLAWRSLRRIDAEVEVRDIEIGLLQKVPMLRPLPVPAIEALASRAQTARYSAEQTIFNQGDPGDRFYVIADGEVRMSIDGGADWMLRPGDWFGELALLRLVPRTATARAVTAVEVRALDAEAFLHAVGGFSSSTREADAIVSKRLGVAI